MGALSSRSFALLTALLASSIIGHVSISAQEVDVPRWGTAAPADVVGASGAPLGALAAQHVADPSTGWPDRRAAWSPFAEPAPISHFDATLAPQDRVRAGTNLALMGFGGAVLVVGMIMGGEDGKVVATAGGVIAVVGLYRYLQ